MISIRPATAEDVPAVLPMVAAICALHEAWDPERYAMRADVVERYARWLPARARDEHGVFLVAEDDGQGGAPRGGGLVGFLVATVDENIPIYRLGEYAFIQDVWVEPEFRRAGVARRLVEAAAERLRAQGVKQVRLETAAANESARRLFESLGFRVGTVDMLRQL